MSVSCRMMWDRYIFTIICTRPGSVCGAEVKPVACVIRDNCFQNNLASRVRLRRHTRVIHFARARFILATSPMGNESKRIATPAPFAPAMPRKTLRYYLYWAVSILTCPFNIIRIFVGFMMMCQFQVLKKVLFKNVDLSKPLHPVRRWLIN